MKLEIRNELKRLVQYMNERELGYWDAKELTPRIIKFEKVSYKDWRLDYRTFKGKKLVDDVAFVFDNGYFEDINFKSDVLTNYMK